MDGQNHTVWCTVLLALQVYIIIHDVYLLFWPTGFGNPMQLQFCAPLHAPLRSCSTIVANWFWQPYAAAVVCTPNMHLYVAAAQS